MSSATLDEVFMKRALELAGRGEGAVSPNPMVGAVLVKDGKILAEGWHRKFGGPHAEAQLFAAARKKNISTVGATLYLNLEPCVAFDSKKTPPCTPEIVCSRLSRVVIAMRDPNHRVSGHGTRLLRDAGIHFDVGCLSEEAQALNEKFNWWARTGRPFVTVKVAMSLDGKIATRTGDSKWITGDAARVHVKVLRDCYDAILVGRGTAMKDNPVLAGKKREPLRIILDSTLQTPHNSHVFRDKNVLLVTTRRATVKNIGFFQKNGVPLKIFPKKISLPSLLSWLGKKHISSILVEGGAEVFGSFLSEKLVQRCYWFIAPKIIGGRDAPSPVGGVGIAMLQKALSIKDWKVETIGDDFMISGRPV